mgnify:CR=1 FL=1
MQDDIDMEPLHKLFIYRKKLVKPYIERLLKWMDGITYMMSALFILTLVYEHGFLISFEEMEMINTLYHFVWIVFLVDISLHILLEYKDTRQTFSMLTWILTFLLYLTLVPVVFHRPEVEGAVQAVWDFLNGKAYHLVLLLVLSFLNLSYGLVRLLGRRTNPSLILAVSFFIIILIGTGLLMLPRSTVAGHLVGGFAVYFHQCGVCDGTDFGRRGIHFHDNGFCNHHSADSDWRSGGDDADKFLRDVLHGEYLFV